MICRDGSFQLVESCRARDRGILASIRARGPYSAVGQVLGASAWRSRKGVNMHAVDERLNHWIDQLQADQHPEGGPDEDPAQVTLLMTAATWAGARPGADEPDPAFLARLRLQVGQAAPASAP